MKIKLIMEFKLGDQALSTAKTIIELIAALLSIIASTITIMMFVH